MNKIKKYLKDVFVSDKHNGKNGLMMITEIDEGATPAESSIKCTIKIEDN